MHFGWFPSNASLSSVLGDLASSGLGNLGISWESSPALTEVEEVVCDWMRQLTGLSEAWSGTIQDTASTACMVALLTARERATDHSQAGGGLPGGRPARPWSTPPARPTRRSARPPCWPATAPTTSVVVDHDDVLRHGPGPPGPS